MPNKIIIFSLLATMTYCYAIDNPDAPDYVNDFLAEAKTFEDKIAQCTCTNSELRQEFEEYNQFIEARLIHSEKLIGYYVKGEADALFKKSQKHWKEQQKLEREFILANWNKQNFGSSYLLSRLNYLAMLKKQRVVSLYHYAKSYPAL